MTNNVIAADINGVNCIFDANTEVKLLGLATGLTVTTTLVDRADGTNYQVPTGKKTTLIFVENWAGGANKSLIYADDEDGTTNEVAMFTPATVITNNIVIFKDVPADKFINQKHASGSGSACEVIAFEESAT